MVEMALVKRGMMQHAGGRVSVCLQTYVDVTLGFLPENAAYAWAWWSTAAQYLWLITAHATATVQHGSEEDIWFVGFENC